MPQWLQEVLEPDGSRFKGRPCHSPAMGSLTNHFTFSARGRHTVCVCLILCSLWAKNHFHILKMVGKKMKRGIVLHDTCKLCEVQLSVSPQYFVDTRPCLFVYRCYDWDLSLAAFDGRVVLVTVTVWPPEAENLYYLAFYSKSLLTLP